MLDDGNRLLFTSLTTKGSIYQRQVFFQPSITAE